MGFGGFSGRGNLSAVQVAASVVLSIADVCAGDGLMHGSRTPNCTLGVGVGRGLTNDSRYKYQIGGSEISADSAARAPYVRPRVNVPAFACLYSERCPSGGVRRRCVAFGGECAGVRGRRSLQSMDSAFAHPGDGRFVGRQLSPHSIVCCSRKSWCGSWGHDDGVGEETRALARAASAAFGGRSGGGGVTGMHRLLDQHEHNLVIHNRIRITQTEA